MDADQKFRRPHFTYEIFPSNETWFAIGRYLPLVGIMSNTNRSKQINTLFDFRLKSHLNTKQYLTLFNFKKDIYFVCKYQCNVKYFRIIFLNPKIGPSLFYDTPTLQRCFLFSLTHSPNIKLIYKKTFILCRVGFLFKYLKKALAYIYIQKGF